MQTELFKQTVSRDIRAAAGCIAVRTKEPLRALNVLKELALTDNYQLSSWDAVNGLRAYDMTAPDAPLKQDAATLQFPAAVKKMSEHLSTDQGEKEKRLYVFLWPEDHIANLPAMRQAIMELSFVIPILGSRLLIVVPKHWQPVSQLQEVITVHELSTPGADELTDTLESCISVYKSLNSDTLSAQDKQKVADLAAGLTLVEAELAFCRAADTAVRSGSHVTLDLLSTTVGEMKVEAIKRTDVLERQATVPPEDIGGLDSLKEWVRVTAQCLTPEAQEFGIDAPRGVMLVGPPGTGKSVSAMAIASMLDLPLIRFDVSRVFNSLVGKSEERIKDAMATISSMAPCVAFIDEIDKVFNIQSGGGDSGTSMRVLGTMLTAMQQNSAGVFWVVTANRVDGLPPELLRKGRLDEIFSVSVPNAVERHAIIGIHLRKRKQNIDTISDIEVAVNASDGYVPSEIEVAVNEALKTAFVTSQPVSGELIAEQLGKMVPLSRSFAEQFSAMQAWAETNARPASAEIPATTPVVAPSGLSRASRMRSRTQMDG